MEYIPGVCNIGPAERAKRRLTGIIGLVITVAVATIFSLTNPPPAWQLVLFFPATLAAISFLQDALHFCAAFGLRGIYNVMASVDTTTSVESAQFRRQDRRKALLIIGLSIAIGATITFLTFL